MKKCKVVKIPIDELEIFRLTGEMQKIVKEVNPKYVRVMKIDNIRGFNVIRYQIEIPEKLRHLTEGHRYFEFFLREIDNKYVNNKLRDRIAIAAMNAKMIGMHKNEVDIEKYIERGMLNEGTTLASMIAEDSYKFADAMLKARSKKLK